MFLDLNVNLNYTRDGVPVFSMFREFITKLFRVNPTITFVQVWKSKITLSVGVTQLRLKKILYLLVNKGPNSRNRTVRKTTMLVRT